MIFIIEMNNDTNKIVGIGIITNKLDSRKRCRIYNNPNHTNQILQFELILVGYFLILPKLHDIFTEKRKKMPFYTQNHILFVVL